VDSTRDLKFLNTIIILIGLKMAKPWTAACTKQRSRW
jgi:hypothetical protein